MHRHTRTHLVLGDEEDVPAHDDVLVAQHGLGAVLLAEVNPKLKPELGHLV